MLKVISFGEALVDMLSNRINTTDNDSLESFTKYPGGAPANVAAAVAKLGGNSYMAGKIGTDMFGQFMSKSLIEAGVHTDYLLTTSEANTALAFVSLDESGERSFTFYRNPSADMLFKPEEFEKSWFEQPGLFHFCSNTLTEPSIREATFSGIKIAKTAGYLVSFDINLRTNLWPTDTDPMAPIWEGLKLADLVKLSKEELDFLCRDQTESQVIEKLLGSGVSLVLLTDGGEPLRYFSHKLEGSISPPEITMVDSTAAGDAFIGGFLFQLAEQNCQQIDLANLAANQSKLEKALAFASHCGAHAVSHKGAFTSLPKLQDLAMT